MTEQTTEQAVDLRPGIYWGTGRRKTAVARVRAMTGEGVIQINGRGLEEFFPRERDRKLVLSPLRATNVEGKVDILVSIKGGGITGQAGALLLGIARALRKLMPETEPLLRDKGYLTRDAREVERKKYGRRGARRSFQFSKR